MHILGINTTARTPEEDRAIGAWQEEMADAAHSYAKKNRIPNVVWTPALLHPGVIGSKDTHYEKLAKQISTADAVFIVSSTRPLIDFTRLSFWVDWYTKVREHNFSGILVEFVFVGQEDPHRLYHLPQAMWQFKQAGMKLVLPDVLWIKRNGDIAHKALARQVVEHLHSTSVQRAA